MQRTPQYQMPFFQSGDLYSASNDRERSVIADYQLKDLADIVGDGVLTGWVVTTASPTTVSISPGTGFIDGIVVQTFAEKIATITPGTTNLVYMTSDTGELSTGLDVSTESAASNIVNVTFSNVTAPAAPTGLAITVVSSSSLSLNWNDNTESDFSYYKVSRATVTGGPYTQIATTTNSNYVDTGLNAATQYFYVVYAVNTSTLTSTASTEDSETTSNIIPGEATYFTAYPSNGSISCTWVKSSTTNVTYQILFEEQQADLTWSTLSTDTGITNPFYQKTGLNNSKLHRLTLKTVSSTSTLSTGITIETMPVESSAPLTPRMAGTPVTSLPHAITLTWLASLSVTGNATGQKHHYNIRVMNGTSTSDTIDVGLALSKTLASYTIDGINYAFIDDVVYTFKITAVDIQENESEGLYITGTTQDTTLPNDPRNLILSAGNTQVTAYWKHSSSTDVVGYNINVRVGTGAYGPDIAIGYLTSYTITGLTNNVQVSIKLKAIDDAGLKSFPGIVASTTPIADTTVPLAPSEFRTSPKDQEVLVMWNKSTDADFSHYVIKRTAIFQTPLAPMGTELTEITYRKTAEDAGRINYYFIDAKILASVDLLGNNWSPTIDTTYYLYVETGIASGQCIEIVSSSPDALIDGHHYGTVTLLTGLLPIPLEGNVFSIRASHPSLGTRELNVGTINKFVDLHMLNENAYAYWIKAVDIYANESDYIGPVIVQPQTGLTVLNAVSDLTASGTTTVSLTWTWSTGSYTGTPTAFNIYRSTNQYYGYEYVDSVMYEVNPHTYTWSETGLVNNVTYYYIVRACRDIVRSTIETSSLVPSHSLLIATVDDVGTITQEQRLIANMQATIQEQVEAKILLHKHDAAISNPISVTAIRYFGTVDVSTLTSTIIAGYSNLSESTKTSLNKFLSNTYDTRTVYYFNPEELVYNAPFIGDFIVLINELPTTLPFIIDETNNTVVFEEALPASAVVSLDGYGYNYYVPYNLNIGNRGFIVKSNGTIETPGIDEDLQTIRYSNPKTTETITIEIEPYVATFNSSVEHVRPINLGTTRILADFTTNNGTLWTSESGDFSDTDTIFVIVDGARTTQPYTIDFGTKTIVFRTALAYTAQVAFEILNQEEVTGTLSADNIDGIDGSTIQTGTLLNAQLGNLSHHGRVEEPMSPAFTTLKTDDKYIYYPDGTTLIAGSATTPYAITQLPNNKILLGTSNGLLIADDFASINNRDDSSSVVDYTGKVPSGMKFTIAKVDEVSDCLTKAELTSGIFNGKLIVNGTEVYGASLVRLDDGTILISGGSEFVELNSTWQDRVETYIYDPNTQIFTRVGDLNFRRSNHAVVLLPDGKVLACGGNYYKIDHQTGSVVDAESINRLATTELYNNITQTWSYSGNMTTSRDFLSAVLINDTEILISGGNTGVSVYNGTVKPPIETRPIPTNTAEIYTISLGTFASTGSMNKSRVFAEADIVNEKAILTGGGQEGSDSFDRLTATWTFTGSQVETNNNSSKLEFNTNATDGPVKQFLLDSISGFTLIVTKNNVYVTETGAAYFKTSGLEAVGVVHKISQDVAGCLYAATDLGIYEITPTLHDSWTWFQGGLIGAGTTETFDLQPWNSGMLAGTEIGVFFSNDYGLTWTEKTDLEDVYNIELAGTTIWIQSGDKLYTSTNSTTWTLVTRLEILNENSKLVLRNPFDLFIATENGIYYTRDGTTFSSIDLPINANEQKNNIWMADVVDTDIFVGYDNVIYSIAPDMSVILRTEFIGIVPTIKQNTSILRGGYRVDVSSNKIIFENKRLSTATIESAYDYSFYYAEHGEWYSHNANATVLVYVNNIEQSSDTLSLDSHLGMVTFAEPLSKTDVVTITISGTTLKNEGELWHEEIEDELGKVKGLPLDLQRIHALNVLQNGMSVDSNFAERGTDRNQYYCYDQGYMDRSFTYFLKNASFNIMGRDSYDITASTVNYLLESEQTDTGIKALIPLCIAEINSDIWVGTEKGIFILDAASPSYPIDSYIELSENNPVRDLMVFGTTVWVVTKNGIYTTTDYSTFTKQDTNNLPISYNIANLNSIILIGTEDGIYYSNTDSEYNIWTKGTYVELTTDTAVSTTGVVTALIVGDGICYSAIGSTIYTSNDGIIWRKSYTFTGKEIYTLSYFAKKLYIGTSAGLYCDDESLKTTTPVMRLELTDGTESASLEFVVNNIYAGSDTLWAVGNSNDVYSLQNGTWSTTTIVETSTIQKVFDTGTNQLAFANDTVFVQ